MILFLGSGVSLASGLPGVSEIQKALLNIEDNPRVLKLYTLLLELDTAYLKHSAPFKYPSGQSGYTGQIFRAATTYEDLFYLLDQIVINAEGLKADVMVEAFSDLVRKKGRAFLKGQRKIDKAIDLHRLATQARDLIEQTVAELLHATAVRGLDLILEIIHSDEVKELHIVTLNHDTLVEQLLTENHINYCDGFGQPIGDVRWYGDDYDPDMNVHIIKPHGSISWWRQAGYNLLQPVLLSDTQTTTWQDNEGRAITNIRTIPAFLTGVSKVFSYNRGIFAEQQYHFLQLLRSTTRIVMSGYG